MALLWGLAIVFMGKFEAVAERVNRLQPDMYVRCIDDIWVTIHGVFGPTVVIL